MPKKKHFENADIQNDKPKDRHVDWQ